MVSPDAHVKVELSSPVDPQHAQVGTLEVASVRKAEADPIRLRFIGLSTVMASPPLIPAAVVGWWHAELKLDLLLPVVHLPIDRRISRLRTELQAEYSGH